MKLQRNDSIPLPHRPQPAKIAHGNMSRLERKGLIPRKIVVECGFEAHQVIDCGGLVEAAETTARAIGTYSCTSSARHTKSPGPERTPGCGSLVSSRKG